jgi:hypothetical protein
MPIGSSTLPSAATRAPKIELGDEPCAQTTHPTFPLKATLGVLDSAESASAFKSVSEPPEAPSLPTQTVGGFGGSVSSHAAKPPPALITAPKRPSTDPFASCLRTSGAPGPDGEMDAAIKVRVDPSTHSCHVPWPLLTTAGKVCVLLGAEVSTSPGEGAPPLRPNPAAKTCAGQE